MQVSHEGMNGFMADYRKRKNSPWWRCSRFPGLRGLIRFVTRWLGLDEEPTIHEFLVGEEILLPHLGK